MKTFTPLLTAQKKFWFLTFDILIFLAAFAIAIMARFSGLHVSMPINTELVLLALAVPTLQYIFGNYDLDHISDFKQLLARQIVAIIFTLLFATLVTYVFATERAGIFGRGILFIALGGFFVLSVAYRSAVASYLKKIKGTLKWLILADAKTQEIVKKDFSQLDFEGTLNFLTPEEALQSKDWLNRKWSTIVVSITNHEHQSQLGPIIIDAKCSGLNTITITTFYERHLRKVPVHLLDYAWFINAGGFYSITNPVKLRLKRIIDISLSLFLLILTAPVLLLTALAIRLESKGDAVYSQIRTGKDNKPFTIYKLRSMRSDAEKDGAKWAQKNDNRITRVGKMIRLTRLDELPQLWNVLRGDMSFVGPRPERPEFNEMLKKELPFYELRHIVRPGITGWAQVLYPYGASVEDSKEKLQFELYYIKHSGTMLDLLIILKTIRVVVGARGR